MDGQPTVQIQKETPTIAIVSLVLGIIGVAGGIFCIGPLLAIPAVICGHIARSRILKAPDRLQGEGIALAGLITGYIAIALMVIILPILVAIAVPSFIKARDASQQSACINNLRQIVSAKEMLAAEQGKKVGDPVSQDQLREYIGGPSFPKCPAGGTYVINPIGTNPTCLKSGHRLPGNGLDE